MFVSIRVMCVMIFFIVILQFQYSYYFPFFPITNSPTPTPITSTIPGPPDNNTIPFPNPGRTFEDDESEEIKQLAVLLTTYPDQKRTSLLRHSLLAKTAKDRCENMAENDYFGHTDPEGYGPNTYAKRNNFEIPDYYNQNDDGNNIESIAGGFSTPLDAFNALLKSPGHRSHLMGEIPFYASQNYFGIYYLEDETSRYHRYYCFEISEMKLQTSGE